uniref:MIT domain-containing protein n=1 Tax=Hyaloperonospora arabidopsidis (strain Emoy2) TaxID=559515 RepID=M4BIW9_HYAAE
MAGRLDLEARLRALRANKRPSTSPPAPSSAPVSSRSDTDSFSYPPSVFRSIQTKLPNPVNHNQDEYGPIRRYSSVSSNGYILFPSTPSSLDKMTDFMQSVAPQGALEPAKVPDKGLQVGAIDLLGPEYEEAVKVAQYAMDKERKQMPHAAIDAYIRAGQILIELGRRQAVPYLQTVVKAKALDLLQRAEALSEWTNDVLAKDSSQQALAAAYQQSQRNCTRSLSEKQKLVSKMQESNLKMKKKLNQLALLTKIRCRMIKAVKARRARKAAEAKARQEADINARVSRDMRKRCGGWSDVTEESGSYSYDDGEDSHIEFSNVTGSSSEEEEEMRKSYECHGNAQTSDGLPREVQKIELINELHERIGLPQIDHFRKFEPLTSDLTTYKRQAQLQAELEVAKQESIKLQAAVEEMEKSLRLAEERSKQLSMRLEEQKAREFAGAQSQLERLREELEMERQRSPSFHSGLPSQDTAKVTDPGSSKSIKDSRAMSQLRSSLYKVFYGHAQQHCRAKNGYTRRTSIHNTSHVNAEDSLHHTPTSSEHSSLEQSFEMDEEEIEEDDDGGIWL